MSFSVNASGATNNVVTFGGNVADKNKDAPSLKADSATADKGEVNSGEVSAEGVDTMA